MGSSLHGVLYACFFIECRSISFTIERTSLFRVSCVVVFRFKLWRPYVLASIGLVLFD